ncbi:MAG: AraC family transcriptional regulator [Alphaproteobacteria bacterium]|nr:MAG: AraC family transcriptional regulator [Alphaproteobacteria bacterium]
MAERTRGESSHCYPVPVANLGPLAALADEAGVPLPMILDELGLPGDLFDTSPTGALSLADYFRIFDRLARAVGDETCHLSSRPLMPGSTHFVFSHIAGARTLGEAMRRVARAYNVLHGGSYNRVEERKDGLVYIVDDRAFPYAARDDDAYIVFTLECVLVFLHCALMMIASDALRGALRKVHTRRRDRTPGGAHLAFLGVPVRRRSPHYALVYDAAAAALPVDLDEADLPAPHAIYRRIVEMIEAEEAGGRALSVQARVRDALERGLDDQEMIARRLGMSVATLRRRLAEEGTGFRALRGQVFDARAKAMLAEGQHAGDIAETLGYADVRSFIRAFKSKNGLTPHAYVGRLRRIPR